MTQDVDIQSTRAADLVEELRRELIEEFDVALRIRRVKGGRGFRLYQVRKPKNRHLVDVRHVEALPTSQRIDGIAVISPAELISNKVLSMTARAKTAKGIIDIADAKRLLLRFPELKTETGPVLATLQACQADAIAINAWKRLVAEDVVPYDPDDEF